MCECVNNSFNLIEWCNTNQGFLSFVLAGITVMISLFSLWSTNRNNAKILKKQQKQEKEIELRQEDMQRRQLKVDTYKYRLECWKVLYEIKEFVSLLKVMFTTGSIYSKNHNELYEIYTRLNETLKYDKKEINLLLEQSKSVFSVNSWNYIEKIKTNFTKLSNDFNMFKMFDELLTEEQKQAKKKENITEIESCIKEILRTINLTISFVNIDLCIADLHSVRGIYKDGAEYIDKFEKEDLK